MRKRVCFTIMALLMAIMTLMPGGNIYAAEDSNIITSEEAVRLARWFMANDVYENHNNGWSEETVIDNIIKIQDNQEYYIITLSNNGKNNGYIIVAGDLRDTLIKEYAYDGYPLFVDLLPVRGSSQNERSTSSSNEDIDLTAENLPYLEKIRNTSEVSTLDYGGITSPLIHVNNTYGGGWVYDSGSTITGFTLLKYG